MPGFASFDSVRGVVLAGAAALQCKAGIIGAVAGVAGDSELFAVLLLKNAGAVTLTIGGLADNTAAAQNVVLSGSTTQDVPYIFPWPWRNEFGPFVFTPAITLTVVVWTRAYVGP